MHRAPVCVLHAPRPCVRAACTAPLCACCMHRAPVRVLHALRPCVRAACTAPLCACCMHRAPCLRACRALGLNLEQTGLPFAGPPCLDGGGACPCTHVCLRMQEGNELCKRGKRKARLRPGSGACFASLHQLTRHGWRGCWGTASTLRALGEPCMCTHRAHVSWDSRRSLPRTPPQPRAGGGGAGARVPGHAA